MADDRPGHSGRFSGSGERYSDISEVNTSGIHVFSQTRAALIAFGNGKTEHHAGVAAKTWI
jgi:hypothetical protein